jgi:uncharacterized protein YidB (DUF937 family)
MKFLNKLMKGTGSQAAIAEGITGLVSSQGGLSGLLDKFKNAGLQEKAESWVSRGENQDVSASEVEEALGEDEVKRIAEQAGVSQQEASQQIASVLPEMVNELTPDGTVPPQAEVEEALAAVEPSAEPEPSQQVEAPHEAEATGAATQTYTVQSGDTLSAIAQQFYGNASDYMRIFEANRDKLDNPNLIQPGQELLIPAA